MSLYHFDEKYMEKTLKIFVKIDFGLFGEKGSEI